MAKDDKKKNYSFPSVFGSHTSMINEAKTEKLQDKNLVVLTDEFGDYTTEKNRLNSGLADPNRYQQSRLDKLFNKRKEEKEE